MGTIDISRNAFNPAKHYSGVRMQQGRVIIDDDWNENERIRLYEKIQSLLDIIGDHGTPDEGFLIEPFKDFPAGRTYNFKINKGTYYVGGLCLNLEEDEYFIEQKDWLLFPQGIENIPILPEDGTDFFDFVYVEAWQQSVTAVEDDELLEKALGGVDTSARNRIFHHIKVQRIDKNIVCAEAFKDIIAKWKKSHDCLLTVGYSDEVKEENLCSPSFGGRYLGAENQTIRVQLTGNNKFTWGYDNASPLYRILIAEGDDGNKIITMITLPKDESHWPQNEQVVEIIPRSSVLSNKQKLADIYGVLGKVTKSFDPDKHLFNASVDFDITGNMEWDSISDPDFFYMRIWNRGTDTDSNAEISFIPDEFVELKHTGLKIKISGTDHQKGDFWIIAARPGSPATVVPWELETGIKPQGIMRHFAPLSIIEWSSTGGKITCTTVADCRKIFPPLNGIMAENVGYDNNHCKMPGVESVKDALDQLCEYRDLRHHNKHLHGWGIVCGLQVFCGPDKDGHHTVYIKPGYALDSSGNNLTIEKDEQKPDFEYDVLNRAIEQKLLNEKGEGEVSLAMYLDKENKIAFEVAKYDSSAPENKWRGGALLQNMYNGCILPLVQFFEKEFKDVKVKDEIVTMAQKRLTVLINLLIQLINKEHGKDVYISPQEDKLIRAFYKELRTLLESKTYCAMFENARQFPDYPKGLDVPSIFGKGFRHTRLRIDPVAKLAYTIGGIDSPAGSNMIHVFDLEVLKMVYELEFPGGTGLKVQDVAFSKDNTELYAIATLNDTDSVIGVAEIIQKPALSFKWKLTSTQCNTIFTSLETCYGLSSNIYAIGREKGLYIIDPANIAIKLVPKPDFDACGHLIVDKDSFRAYATARLKGIPDKDLTKYDHVLRIDLKSLETEEFILSSRDKKTTFTGEDDIAFGKGKNGQFLFVVADPRPDLGKIYKQLLVFGKSQAGLPDNIFDLDENTDIKLSYNPITNFLMVTYEDSFRVRIVDCNEMILSPSYHHPLQVFPQSIVYAPNKNKSPMVYLFNWMSNTINVVPAKRFAGKYEFPLEALEEYRKKIFDAFSDLVGGFFQYLKDCFCSQFLVSCPDETNGKKIYLACISIKNDSIYQICNFSKRKYVKTFPTLEYWLSFIPVAPVIRAVFEKIGCSVLPDVLNRFTTIDTKIDVIRPLLTGSRLRFGYAKYMRTDVKGQYKEKLSSFKTVGNLSGDWLMEQTKKKITVPEKVVSHESVVGRPANEVEKSLSNANIIVERTEQYNPRNASKYAKTFAGAPPRIKEGQRVILYEKDGMIQYYSLVDEKSQEITDLSQKVQSHDDKMKEFSGFRDDIDKLTLKVSDSQEEIRKAKIMDVSSFQDDLNSLSNKFESSREELLKGKEEEMKSFQSNLEDIRLRFEKTEQDIRQNMGESLDSLKNDLNNLKIQHDSAIEKVQTDKASEIEGLKNEIRVFTARLDDVNSNYQKSISERDQEIVSLRGTINGFSEKMKKMDDLEAKVNKLSIKGRG
jgi:hypothetical protein